MLTTETVRFNVLLQSGPFPCLKNKSIFNQVGRGHFYQEIGWPFTFVNIVSQCLTVSEVLHFLQFLRCPLEAIPLFVHPLSKCLIIAKSSKVNINGHTKKVSASVHVMFMFMSQRGESLEMPGHTIQQHTFCKLEDRPELSNNIVFTFVFLYRG